MADEKRTIDIIFQGVDQTGKAIKGITASVDKFSGGIGDLTAPLADMTGSLLKVEAAIVAVGTAYAVYAFDSAKKFESAQIELQKVLSDSDGQASQFDDTVFELSNTYGIASADILASAANFKQSGFTTAEAFDLVAVSLDQAIAGELEAARSSELLVAALKGFKAPAEDAGRLVDILNATSNEYATSLDQLAVGMAKFSPIAGKMGLSFEETAGLLTPVIEVFRSGDEAAIALRTGLLKLIDDTAPVKAGLESIGVSQTDANGALRSGKDILLDVSTAFKTLDENQKLFVTQQLVGIQQSAKMVEVFDQLGKSQEITAKAMDAAGSAAAEVEARLASAEIAVARSSVAFENLATVVGLNFKNEVVDVINGVTALEIAMQSVVTDGGLEPLFTALKPQIKAISDLLQAMAKNLPEAFESIDFTRLVNSFSGLGIEITNAFEAFFGPVDLTSVDGLKATIQGVVDAIALLTELTGGVIQGFEPFIEQLGKMKDAFIDMDSTTANTVGNILGVATAINGLIAPLGSALSAVNGLGTALEVMAGVQVVKLATSIGVGSVASAALWAFSGGLVALGAAAGGAAGVLADEHIPAYHSFITALTDATAAGLGLAFFENDTNEIREAGTKITLEQIEAFKARTKILEETPTEISTTIAVDATIDPEIQALLDDDTALEAAIKVSVDNGSVIEAQQDLAKAAGAAVYDSETGTWVNTVAVVAELDVDSVAAAAEKLDVVTADKALQFKTELDIATIEKQAKLMTTALTVSAQVDIAELEAAARTIESLGDGIETIFETSSTIVSELFGQLAGLSSQSKAYTDILIQVNKENDLRAAALDLQERLTNAQIAYMEARTAAMANGDAVISIEADGLEPELEAFMWKIIERVQIRAAAEQAEFLLGI